MTVTTPPVTHLPDERQEHDAVVLRQVFGAFPTGVMAVAAEIDGRPVGLAASSFTSVSLRPALVSLCIARGSRTWEELRHAPRIGLSILATDQERHGRQLAARDADRFAGIAWRASPSGAIVVDGASGWLEVSVHDEVVAGDHDIVVLAVHRLSADPLIRPLVFHASRFVALHAGADGAI